MVHAIAGFVLAWLMFLWFAPTMTGRSVRQIYDRFMKGWNDASHR